MSQPQAQNAYYTLCSVVFIHTDARGESTEHRYDIEHFAAAHSLQGKLDRYLKRSLPSVKLMRIESIPNGGILLYTETPLQQVAADRYFHIVVSWLDNERR